MSSSYLNTGNKIGQQRNRGRIVLSQQPTMLIRFSDLRLLFWKFKNYGKHLVFTENGYAIPSLFRNWENSLLWYYTKEAHETETELGLTNCDYQCIVSISNYLK